MRKTEPVWDTLIRSRCACKMQRECVRFNFSEMGRLWGVKLRKNKYNLKEGHFDVSKFALYAIEEGHKTDWTQDPILQIEPHSAFWQYK